MRKLQVLDLFSGIGGFSLGLERTGGFETVAFCEIEEFPRRVLAKHWPEVPCYHDVRTLTKDTLDRDGIAVDVITGGFPCQDISVAGKQAGLGSETRSGLWSECLRLTSELRPEIALFENVANLLSGPSNKPGAWFSRILSDLASIGYDAEWRCISASEMGMEHKRTRVWIVANPDENRQSKSRPLVRQNKRSAAINWKASGLFDAFQRKDLPYVCGEHNGFSDWMDRVAACGNAVVPQIPELIGKAILASRAA